MSISSRKLEADFDAIKNLRSHDEQIELLAHLCEHLGFEPVSKKLIPMENPVMQIISTHAKAHGFVLVSLHEYEQLLMKCEQREEVMVERTSAVSKMLASIDAAIVVAEEEFKTSKREAAASTLIDLQNQRLRLEAYLPDDNIVDDASDDITLKDIYQKLERLLEIATAKKVGRRPTLDEVQKLPDLPVTDDFGAEFDRNLRYIKRLHSLIAPITLKILAQAQYKYEDPDRVAEYFKQLFEAFISEMNIKFNRNAREADDFIVDFINDEVKS